MGACMRLGTAGQAGSGNKAMEAVLHEGLYTLEETELALGSASRDEEAGVGSCVVRHLHQTGAQASHGSGDKAVEVVLCKGLAGLEEIEGALGLGLDR